MMHNLLSSWLDTQKRKHTLVLMFVDFRKAFDSICHNKLVTKLIEIGLEGNLLKMLRSYLTDRHQCVKVQEKTSKFLPLSTGVPQGSILSPTLFQIYLNDLLSLPLLSSAHAYADDVTIYISDKNHMLLQQRINTDLLQIQQWCDQNNLTINLKKSHYVIVNEPENFKISISLPQGDLQQKTTSTLLGFTINNRLTWHDHLQQLSSKIASNMRLFYNLRHLMDFKTATQFYQNFIHSFLTYGTHLYYALSPANLTDPIYRLQKCALRLVCSQLTRTNTHKTPSTLSVVTKVNVLPLPKLSEYNACILGHNILNNNCPTYLSSIFAKTHPKRPTRDPYKLPSSASYNRLNQYLLNSFNTLPKALRSKANISTFKTSLKLNLMSTLH